MQGLAWARGKADEARSRVEDGDHLTRVKDGQEGDQARRVRQHVRQRCRVDWVKSEATPREMDARLPRTRSRRV